MEVLKEFSENSTIHGIAYISRTRRCIRLVWTLTVLTGFVTAGFLIKQSLNDWELNPIATTITTAPIEQVTYPLIYVCPPRNTFTNLNYDLERLPNEKLDPDYVDELLRLVDEKIQDAELEMALSDLNTFEEGNKYRNWYLGFTNFTLPYYYYNFGHLEHIIKYETTSTSGTVSSPFFETPYDERNFLLVTDYSFNFTNLLPKINEETSLILEVDIDTKETEGGSESFVYVSGAKKETYKLTGPMTKSFTFGSSTNITTLELCKIIMIQGIVEKNLKNNLLTQLNLACKIS